MSSGPHAPHAASQGEGRERRRLRPRQRPEGPTLTSLEEQNAFLLNWESTVADTRIHGTTHSQVGQHFAAVEQ